MRLFYFDPCKADCFKFESFFTEVFQKEIRSGTIDAVVGSDSDDLYNKITVQKGFDLGFVDFYVANLFQGSSAWLVEKLRKNYVAPIYGLIPVMSMVDLQVMDLQRKEWIEPELLYKNTLFLDDVIVREIRRVSREISIIKREGVHRVR